MTHLQDLYLQVNQIINTLDFNALFAGFHPYKFALYNRKEICLDGTIIPYQDNFRGNTSLLYDGQYMAIWNIEFDPVDDIEKLAYLLVHEMFHCHQNTNNEQRYPSDLALLNYPGDIENFNTKYNENLYLTNAYQHQDITVFKKFAILRHQRLIQLPQYVKQELLCETLEGMAEYIGLKALKHINVHKFTEIVNAYIIKLRSESDLLFDIRRISYYTGALYFLCLDTFNDQIKNDFHSELTIFEQNPISTERIIVEVRSFDYIEPKYKALIQQKETIINNHIAHAKYMECDASISCYDPMNMFRLKNKIYCKYFVCLKENDQPIIFNEPIVLNLRENSDRDVKGYYLLSQKQS